MICENFIDKNIAQYIDQENILKESILHQSQKASYRALDEQELQSFLQGYTSNSYFVEESLPQKKKTNILRHFPIPTEERILATVDATVFGSHKNGLVFGVSTLYANNDWTAESFSGSMSYEEFSQAKIEVRAHSIFFGDQFRVCMSGSQMKTEYLCELLAELQNLMWTNK